MSDLTGDAEKSPQNKITLRAQLLTARRSLTPADRAAAAAQLQDQTLAHVRRTAPEVIAAYVPSGSEPGGPDLPDVLRDALPPGGRLLLPVLLPDNDLDWAEYTGTLTAGRRGLREPPGPRLGVNAIRSADLILVPALAVDRDGLRLGRGGGSYDRALSRLPPPNPQTPPHPSPPGPQPPFLRPTPDSQLSAHLPSPDPQATAHQPPAGPQAVAHRPPANPQAVAHQSSSDPQATAHRVRPGPQVVALLHDHEAVDTVPAEPHDRPVHGILTPAGGFSPRPA